MALTTLGVAPRSDIDPFAPGNLLDPVPMHRQLRETGPVVYLTAHDVYAVTDHATTRQVLSAWEDFQVGAGVGLANFHKATPWRPRATPTESDPPEHDAPRRVLTDVLGPSALRALHDEWRAEADRCVRDALVAGDIDAHADLAARFPLTVFPDAVGLPSEGREDLLAYGNLVFNAFGPDNELLRQSAQRLGELSAWVTTLCQRASLRPGGLGMAIYEAADRGELLPEQAPLVVRSLLSAGVDTTVHGLTATLLALATHPEEWAALRERPELARVAFDEAVRWASPLQTVFHTTSREVELAGVVIPRHEKVMMFLGAANRDPARFEDPDRFTLGRDPSGHVGFGMGIHQCVGQHVARLEATCLLRSLAEQCSRIELRGTPTQVPNNTLQSWSAVPMRLTAG